MPSNSTPTRCVIYCRVSTTNQEADGTSLGTQEARCRDYLVEQNWSLIDVFIDVHTGAEYRQRPALSALRQRVRNGEVDVILSYSVDRLSRNQAHLAIIADEASEHGARLAFVTEDFEDSAVGRFILTAKAFAGEVEREKLLERTVRGKRARVEHGAYSNGNVPPYGYRWRDAATKAALDPDPATAPIVVRIFHEVAGGTSARRLMQTLYDEGIPSPRGCPWWSTRTIAAMVRHPVYIGEPTAFRWNKTKGSVMAQRPETEHLRLDPSVAPALIEREVAQAAQARLASNRQMSVRNNRDPESALLRGGFATCGYCGGNLVTHRDRDGRPQYRCCRRGPNRTCPGYAIDAGVLDRAVWQRVERVLTHPETVAAELRQHRQNGGLSNDLARVTTTLAQIAKQQTNVAAAIKTLDDPDASAPLVVQLQTLAASKRLVEAERDDLLARVADERAEEDRVRGLTTWAGTVAANIATLGYAEKRLAIDALGVQARVWRTDHDPRYEITLSLDILEPPSWWECSLD